MDKIITAPKIRNYAHWLGRMGYRSYDCQCSYDSESYLLINAIFDELKKIKPTRDNRIWDLWIRADRGPLTDFADPNDEDDKECYCFETLEELEAIWKEYYPNETLWYDFCAVEDDGGAYRAIFLNNKHVIEVDNRRDRSGYEHNISEFATWLLAAVKQVVAELNDGVYNQKVNAELPPELKTGTIVRKDYFDAFPECREEFYEGLTEENIRTFGYYVTCEPKRQSGPFGHRKTMTANDFFRACAIGYEANNYKDCSRSPKEQYEGNADGRDEGLTAIDPDSPEAFEKWYFRKDRGGGHPWEIFPGGNSTHISLYVGHDEWGFYYRLAGSSVGRCVETIRMYLALMEQGIVTFLEDGENLLKRLNETEKIGIVPQGITPRYCHGMFPGEDIISFMNLPYETEDMEKMLPYCVWQELETIELAR